MKLSHYALTVFLCSSSAYAATFLQDWNTKTNLGLTMTRGNSQTSLITSSIALNKTKGKKEYNMGLAYSFSENSGTTTANELTGLYNYNYLLSDKNYTGFRAEARRDGIANVDYRLQTTATYGRHFIKSDKSAFSLDSGLGFTVESLKGLHKNYAHLYVGEKAMRKVTDNTHIFQTLAVYKDLFDVAKFNLLFTIGVETKMNEKLSLRVVLQDKYESRPAEGSYRNDMKLISGVSYQF